MNTLFSVNGAAEYLGVAPITVRRILAAGKFPHHRVGTRIIFTYEDIDAFLSSCGVPATVALSLRERQAQAAAAKRVTVRQNEPELNPN